MPCINASFGNSATFRELPTKMAEVLSSVLTGVNILLLDFFISLSKASDANIVNFTWFVKIPILRFFAGRLNDVIGNLKTPNRNRQKRVTGYVWEEFFFDNIPVSAHQTVYDIFIIQFVLVNRSIRSLSPLK